MKYQLYYNIVIFYLYVTLNIIITIAYSIKLMCGSEAPFGLTEWQTK